MKRAAHEVSMNLPTSDKLRYVLIDLELTGLETQLDDIVEIGVIGTTSDLTPLFDQKIVVRPRLHGLDRIHSNPIATSMHQANGLLAELEAGQYGNTLPTIAEAEHAVIALIDSFEHEDQLVLGGSGVWHCDLRFLRHHTPSLAAYFHDREILEAGILRRTYKAATGTDLVEANAEKNHRADVDIACSLRELRAFFDLFQRNALAVAAEEASAETKYVGPVDDILGMLASLEQRTAGEDAVADVLSSSMNLERQTKALSNIARLLVSTLQREVGVSDTEIFSSLRRSLVAQISSEGAIDAA
jgi:oligoribonuclease